MDNAPTLTPFGIAVIDMGLTPSQQQHILALAGRLKISQTDTDIVRICTYVKTEGTMQATLEKVEEHLASGLAKIDDMTSKLSAEIEERTNTLVSSVSTEIGNAIREKVDNLPNVISDAVDTHVQKRTDLIIEKTVIKTNNDRDQLKYLTERRKDRRGYGIALAGVLALSVGLVAVTRSVTWDQATAMNTRLIQMEKRPDLPVWLNWMRFTDGNKANAQFCGPSQQIVIDGRTYCQVMLPIEPGLQSKTGLDGLVAIWREVQVKLGFYGAVALGAVLAGTLLTIRARRKAA